MVTFTELFDHIDQTKSTNEKIHYIAEYFSNNTSEEAAWALFFLSGQKLKRIVGSSDLYHWCLEATGLPEWIAQEAYAAVGDVAETVALLLAHQSTTSPTSTFSLSAWVQNRLLPLQGLPADQQKEKILLAWRELDPKGIFIINKILTGSFRVGVSQAITIQALSKALNISKETLSLRLMGNWTPSAEFYDHLAAHEDLTSKTHLNPYPFYLASPLEESLENLGSCQEWCAEWKWDGIRAQCVKRGGQDAIWSRGNELVTHQFPEIAEALKDFEDGIVLDGEILAYAEGKPLPFGTLQKRLGRKKLSKSMVQLVPLVFMVYDLLEYRGEDIRTYPFVKRRELFETWDKLDPHIHISPMIPFTQWDDLKRMREEEAEASGTEGLMLKKADSEYGMGRKKGNWWKYKIDPKTIDAVLLYAQPGQGNRASLYTDYTFGVWQEDELVPITKSYSGLTQEEILELDRWIRKNTTEKFGPVRKVKPEQVFELAFEGIQKSPRHKSGVALRFPRIVRWRKDKPMAECDTLTDIKTEFLREI